MGGLALAELQPTVPEHEVQTHTHEDAHLLLLLAGSYVSSAQGMPLVCNVATLVLNPPGTRHRDRFHGLEGRFFTLSWSEARWRLACHRRRLPQHALRLGGIGTGSSVVTAARIAALGRCLAIGDRIDVRDAAR